MSNRILYIFLMMLIPLMGFSQKEAREILHARVVADSLQADNITVRNISSNISAVTDKLGKFTIYARPTDTLHFSSVTFYSIKMVLKKEHFLTEELVIKLNVNVTVLDEVVITANPLTGDLDKDSKKLKTQNITSGFNSGAIATGYVRKHKYSEDINPLMGPTERDLQGLNFVGLYNAIFKKKKKKDVQQDNMFKRRPSFTEAVKERFTYHFFTETLRIPKDEIGLFLNFCDSSPEASLLVEPQKEFELTDYLVSKSAEYLKKSK